MIVWIMFYIFEIIFWRWVTKWGGAEWLEGTFTSGFLIHIFAPSWTSEGIKLFVWVYFIAASIWFVAGVFFPSIRLV